MEAVVNLSQYFPEIHEKTANNFRNLNFIPPECQSRSSGLSDSHHVTRNAIMRCKVRVGYERMTFCRHVLI